MFYEVVQKKAYKSKIWNKKIFKRSTSTSSWYDRELDIDGTPHIQSCLLLRNL